MLRDDAQHRFLISLCSVDFNIAGANILYESKKVKFSHTRYRALFGPGADPGVQAVSPQVT